MSRTTILVPTPLLAMINLRAFSRSLFLAASAMLVAACGSDITGPSLTQQVAAPNAGLLSLLLPVDGIKRNTPLAQDITVRSSIGPNGGTLSIPAAGLTVVIPRNAVKKTTAFTVTAVKGSLVAYEFGPHGTQFPEALEATQDLRGTDVGLLSLPLLRAGYFLDRSALNQRTGTGLVSELVNGVTDLLRRQFRWKIRHFSGYMVAWA